MMKLIKNQYKLRTPCQPFDFQKYDAKITSQEMIKIMDYHNGIGLSANQVGLDASIFVMKYSLEPNNPLIVINPKILWCSTELCEMEEGCLSFPDLFIKVKRPQEIQVEFVDINQKMCIMHLYSINARCFLHEYDHLQGILFTDRVSRVKVQMAKKKLVKRKNNDRTL